MYFARHIFKLKIIGAGWGAILRVTSCALVTEETAEPGEGATFSAIWPKRLLATDTIGERLSPDVADDDDAPAEVIASPPAPRPQPGGGLRRRR